MPHENEKIPKNFRTLPIPGRIVAGCALLAFWTTAACGNVLLAQRARFSDPFELQTGNGQPAVFQGTVQAPAGQFPPAQIPPQTFSPAQFPQPNPAPLPQFQPGTFPSITTTPPPGTIFQQPQPNVIPGPVYDPFSPSSNAWPIQPGLASPQGPVFLPPAGTGPPPVLSFGNGPTNSGLLQNYPQGSAPNTPSAWPNQLWTRLKNETFPRLLEHPRWRQTWLEGGSGNEIDMLETEIATTLTLPSLRNNLAALRVSPGFIFHFLDGPDTPITGFDMPAQVYSPYVAFDLASDPRKNAGLETNLTIGVYTDFRNVSSDSLRLTGTGLGWVRVNPYTVFKLGVEYYDRVNLKILPAFGYTMQPNSDMKLDLYFPRPRFSHKLPGLGNYEIWGYVGAEYGGGSWTIERLGGMDDQADINDVRAFAGVEWVGPRRVTGFLEAGYVFERELLYRSNPLNKLILEDTVMIRTGIAF